MKLHYLLLSLVVLSFSTIGAMKRKARSSTRKRTRVNYAAFGDGKQNKKTRKSKKSRKKAKKDSQAELNARLLASCKSGDLQSAMDLLRAGASANASDQSGSILHYACQYGALALVKLLLAQGANKEALTQEDATPLYIAAQYGHKDVVKVLVDKGAEIDAQTQGPGLTPLHLAEWKGHKEVVEVLVAKGAKIDALTRKGLTLLQIAVFFGKKDVVERLLKYNADITALTSDGRFLVNIALQRGHDDLAEYLEKYIKAQELQIAQNLDVFASLAMRINAPEILVEIERGTTECIRGLMESHTYTADVLKNAIVRALELKRKDVADLLISAEAVPLQNVAYSTESKLRKVRVG